MTKSRGGGVFEVWGRYSLWEMTPGETEYVAGQGLGSRNNKGIVIIYLWGVVVGSGGTRWNNSIKRGDGDEIFLI